jgi:dTDP-4-dehydrorhamnose reductase
MVKPDNIYAEHKLEMEQRVLDIAPDSVVLRAEWMYDYYLKKSNYFMNILNAEKSVAFSSQQFRGVTYVKEVAEHTERLLSVPGGVYNFGSETTKSIYEITKDFLKYIGKNIAVEDVHPRHNLWMNCEKARKNGVVFSSVEDGLKKCAEDYKSLL